jgi:hypothetical protein
MRAASSRSIAWLIALLVGACAGAGQTPQPDGCVAQICGSDDAGCDAIILEGMWIWNGDACVMARTSGCGTVGPDCNALYPSQAECEAAWSHCLAKPSHQ